MSVMDVFEILFKSNAKQTEKDINQVGDAADKSTQKINETDKQTQKLSDSLLKAGLEGIAAFTSFQGIKDGITSAVTFNAALERTAQLTGASADELAAYDKTFAQFGTKEGEFASAFESVAHQVLAINGNVSAIIPNILELGKEMQKLEKTDGIDAARALFERRNAQLGGALPANLEIALLADPEKFAKALEQQEKSLNITKESVQEAEQLEAGWKSLATESQAAFTSLTPILEVVLAISKEIVKSFRMFFDLITFNHTDMDRVLKEGVFRKSADVIAVDSLKDGSGAKSTKVPAAGSNKEQSRAFWLSQGYTPAQVAGLLANEQVESGGFQTNPVGDGGAARGIFQWHSDRRQRILAATGIDVATASHADQLRAAAWELQARGDADRLKATTTPEEAAAVVSKEFERPGDVYGQAHLRGVIAGKEMMNFADNTPINNTAGGSNQQTNVTIGTVVVHSQATDAQGIAGDIQKTLKEQLTYLAANSNDGIAR